MRYCERFAVTQLPLPRVLIVANPSQAAEFSSALDELRGAVDVICSSGGDSALAEFQARRPAVVVIASMLDTGDARSLMAAFSSMVDRSKLGVVFVGSSDGPVRTAVDAIDPPPHSHDGSAAHLDDPGDPGKSPTGGKSLTRDKAGVIDHAPDRFIPHPVAPAALRVAVRSVLETVTHRNQNGSTPEADYGDSSVVKVVQRARWEALADILGEPETATHASNRTDSDDNDEASLLPPLFEIRPRRDHEPIVPIESWGREAMDELAMDRDSGYLVHDDADPNETPELQLSRVRTPTSPPPIPAIRSRALSDAVPRPRPAWRSGRAAAEDDWSEPTPLSEVGERLESGASVEEVLADEAVHASDRESKPAPVVPPDEVGEFDDPDLIVPTPVPSLAQDDRGAGQDFARQLRAKMSLMAQRLFHSEADLEQRAEVVPSRPIATDVDLAALGDGHLIDGGITTVERTGFERRERTSSPKISSWATQVRERGLPDTGEIVRGVSDAPVVLAALFARGTTGRVAFRLDNLEKVVFLDAGRPVFAASNAPGDRMGELLVREGKITAAQYDRCQADVLRSGRRIGEILVEFGYLKRRELLPAVRRHVEDIVFSLFGWVGGQYQITHDSTASSERIRMSRHPASLVLEGIRRKLDRATLERLVGPPSTVVELIAHPRGSGHHPGDPGKPMPRDAARSDAAHRDKLGSMVNVSDLSDEERAALAAFDGRNDLAAVARAAGVDVADVLPLAWGLCVLGLAVARRADIEEPSTVLIGESDVAIDRERIRARWELVAEADYFALLGVRRDATAFEIRRAYQLACRDFAADGFSADLRRELSRELTEIATVLDEAYRVMRDDQLRVMYLSHLPM